MGMVFRQMYRVIPDDKEFAIISDRHRSISKAIGKVYPIAARGICTYHLRKNIIAKFRGGEGCRLFKKAATAYRLDEFNAFLSQIQEVDGRFYQYLLRADYRLWSRVHFLGNRFNFTTSNIAESINHALGEARTLPIVHLLDSIRTMLTKWFSKRRAKASSTKTILTTAIEKVLKARIADATQYRVQELGEHQAFVYGSGPAHLVNLTAKTCSCKRFDVDKIPCVHALAAAEAKGFSKIDLTDPFYYTSYLYHAYAGIVMPSDSALPIPEDVASKVCNPPLFGTNLGGQRIHERKVGSSALVRQRKNAQREYLLAQNVMVADIMSGHASWMNTVVKYDTS